ncbi:MAG: hypothetical protein ACYS99_13060 [Planctomycetota bacterium]
MEATGEVCPSGWKKGDPAMEPSRTGVAKYLKGYRERL